MAGALHWLLEDVDLALSSLALGTPLPSLGRRGREFSLLLPNTWHNFLSVIQQEKKFSTSENARRRFLLFQGAFKQVIKARSLGLA